MSNGNDALQRAERYLETAAFVLEDGDLETAVSRSYYAMFFLARALLKREGIMPKTHKGVVNQFGLHFVKQGPISDKYGRALREMEELRSFADYAESRVMSEADAETALRDARAFVDRLRPMLVG